MSKMEVLEERKEQSYSLQRNTISTVLFFVRGNTQAEPPVTITLELENKREKVVVTST